MREVFTKKAPAAIGPYSQAVIGGGIMCISGQLPIDPESGDMPQDIKAQAEQSLKNLRAIIEEAGCKMSDVLKTTVYLADIGDFASANEVYDGFFEKPYPARVAFQAAALPKGARIEIEAIVHVGS